MSTAPVTSDAPSSVRQTKRQSAIHRWALGQPLPLSPELSQHARRRNRLARRGDTAVAILTLLGGFLLSNFNRMPQGLDEFLNVRLTIKNLLLVVGFAGAWRLICITAGLYDPRLIGDWSRERWRVVAAVTAGTALALVFPAISRTRAFEHTAVGYFWMGSVGFMLLWRQLLRAILEAETAKVRDVLIVGSGPMAGAIFRDLGAPESKGYRVLGFVDSAQGEVVEEVRGRLVGTLEELEHLLMRSAVDEVIVALPARSRYAEIQRAIEICERGGVPIRYPADVFQHRRALDPHWSDAAFAVLPSGRSRGDPRSRLKRGADVVLASLVLALVSPILAIAAAAIKLSDGGPSLFVQERYGLNKRRFWMYKLRTMVMDAESRQGALESQNEASGPVFKIRDDPRVTPVGRILRRLSIDELPQLINVIRGDMSLVGPRPLPTRDVSRFSEPSLMRRFSVQPGITGLWQVSGRSELHFEDWVELDLKYIDEWSLALDLRILLQTLPTVLRGTGAV
jgi:exopolysaccharide biosynthesis polyprenyl glycosylphosphotransferase